MPEEKEQPAEELKNVNKHDFYFETPLYDFIKKEQLEEDIHEGDVDAYSAANGIDTTYKIYSCRVNGQYESSFNNFYKITLTCKRKSNDVLRFFVYDNNEIIVKVGQFPSIADIQFAELGKKYDKVLPKQDLHDLKKSIGLMAHGAGAGSLVYLRRIFENVIWNTYKEHKDKLGISDDDFLKKRMDEKVDFLKDYLPSQLVEMKVVYGILSKGVHELSEEECLAYFPALKLSIILILDQKIEEDVKNKKESLVKKAIADIAQKVNGNKNI